MVAKISLGGNLYGALAYNQDKIDRGKGQILETNRVFVPADGRFVLGECVCDFERTMPSQVTTTRGIVHISLNPHPNDKLTDDQLTDIGREYIERMGFGGQPWMLFKHEDIDREHLHIVTTRVRGDGTLISDKNNYEKSRKITDDLERKYGLHPKGERQGEAWQFKPIDAERGDLKRQVGNVVKSLSEQYKFNSLPGYRALLSLYNVGVEKVEGDNKGNRYTGLVYSALDADGNRVGQPLKSSLFGKKSGIGELERAMTKSGEEVKTKGLPSGLRATVAASLADSGTGGEFRARLRDKGIDLVLRYGNGGRLFGATFIDHNSRVVLNGSVLGKDFAANANAERFPDLATESRENRRPVQAPTSSPDTMETVRSVEQPMPAKETQQSSAPSPTGSAQTTPTPEALHPTMHSTPDDGLFAAQTETFDPSSFAATEVHPASPDLPPILSSVGDAAGSLLSILTPDPGGQSDNQSPVRRRIIPKKKKQSQGQSW
jgi:hypothetical protein